MRELWVKNDENSTIELYDEWTNVLNNVDIDLVDEHLVKWTEKVYKIVAKKLDFGEPFELVDLEDLPLDEVMKGITYTCKITK